MAQIEQNEGTSKISVSEDDEIPVVLAANQGYVQFYIHVCSRLQTIYRNKEIIKYIFFILILSRKAKMK